MKTKKHRHKKKKQTQKYKKEALQGDFYQALLNQKNKKYMMEDKLNQYEQYEIKKT